MRIPFCTALQKNTRARRTAAAIALPLSVLVLAPSLGAQDKIGQDKTAPAHSAIFAPADIRSEIAYLASDELRGRGSGEPGNDRAAQYVAREFAKDGLKPLGTNRQRDPNATLDQSGYYQPFTFVAGRVVGKNNKLSIDYGTPRKPITIAAPNGQTALVESGRAIVLYSNRDFQPSSVSGAGKVEGPLVFVGYGIHAPKAGHDDYEGVDAKSKIVVMLAGSPKDDPHSPLADYADIYRKATTARDLGAVGVLVVLPKSADTFAQSPAVFDNASDAGLPVLRLRRFAAASLLQGAQKSLDAAQQQVDEGKTVSFAFPANQAAQIQADVHKVEKVTANVVGIIEGSDPVLKNEYVVIGAHMDHLGMGGPGSLATSKAPAIHHGADDNASGTAGVMQLARYFARGTENTGLQRPRRSIVLMCFSGEELGLFGSDWYVKHPIVPMDKTVAMLNMDMVGRLRDNKLIVIGSGTATEWNGLLDDLNKTAGFALAKSESGFGASDQQSFYTKNVPVLFFFTGTHPQYHTPQDTVDLINAEGEAKVLNLVADCARRVANDVSRPTFQRIQTPDQNAPSRGLRVYFGSVPDYAAMVEGVQLNGVREGSPAEKAGLKAGDIITKFGDKIIKNVYDYTYALQDHKPGDVVQVIVTRAAQSLTLTVTLTARPE